MSNLQQNIVFIAVSRPEGLAIMNFITLIQRNEEDPGYIREATPENIEAELAKSGFGGCAWRIIQPGEVPQDRTYRDAWTDTGTAIEHDMEKARAIHMDRIRTARNASLNALDVEINKASDSNYDPKAVSALRGKRQFLRDIPQTFDLSKCETVEQLKAAWPAELNPLQ